MNKIFVFLFCAPIFTTILPSWGAESWVPYKNLRWATKSDNFFRNSQFVKPKFNTKEYWRGILKEKNFFAEPDWRNTLIKGVIPRNANLDQINISGADFTRAKYIDLNLNPAPITLKWLKSRGAQWDAYNPPKVSY